MSSYQKSEHCAPFIVRTLQWLIIKIGTCVKKPKVVLQWLVYTNSYRRNSYRSIECVETPFWGVHRRRKRILAHFIETTSQKGILSNFPLHRQIKKPIYSSLTYQFCLSVVISWLYYKVKIFDCFW